ncbi:hypothetical protein LEP1GSC034_3853 [Leptospira interrogans str. 2003000735]|uniref:hypothetical protein n=1 Tax=Leptospira interrogans TaxID=173 RepID=UPI0002B92798|nr:hypothetical protein [Leptospira interrogans]EMJ67079.1 hypothetical protein LEP1GSC034_3853 [Leptospira interrogans str. 2003000735]EMJ78625.1 hypothetical protein LEP1GSC032_0104 [Leptospira interrogans str. 2002000631]MCL8310133.1 hypothetical protein [Leptospira interrogans]
MNLLLKSKFTGSELAEIKIKIEGELEDFPDENTFVQYCKQSFGWSRKESLAAMQDFLDVKVKARYKLL